MVQGCCITTHLCCMLTAWLQSHQNLRTEAKMEESLFRRGVGWGVVHPTNQLTSNGFSWCQDSGGGWGFPAKHDMSICSPINHDTRFYNTGSQFSAKSLSVAYLPTAIG